MKASRATGEIDVALTISVVDGRITNIRALSIRDDQQAAAREIVAEITRPARVGWLRRLFQLWRDTGSGRPESAARDSNR